MHLYIIQSSNNGCFKVGRSSNPKKRLQQLQTGNPYKLKIILVLEDMGRIEKSVHSFITLNARKKCKGEWFEYEKMSCLPDNIYEMLDLDDVNFWWHHQS